MEDIYIYIYMAVVSVGVSVCLFACSSVRLHAFIPRLLVCAPSSSLLARPSISFVFGHILFVPVPIQLILVSIRAVPVISPRHGL